MTLTFDLPPDVEQKYTAEARVRGVGLEQVVREVLIRNQPVDPMLSAHGFGLLGGAEDAALLDEAVAMAMEERHRPSRRV